MASNALGNTAMGYAPPSEEQEQVSIGTPASQPSPPAAAAVGNLLPPAVAPVQHAIGPALAAGQQAHQGVGAAAAQQGGGAQAASGVMSDAERARRISKAISENNNVPPNLHKFPNVMAALEMAKQREAEFPGTPRGLKMGPKICLFAVRAKKKFDGKRIEVEVARMHKPAGIVARDLRVIWKCLKKGQQNRVLPEGLDLLLPNAPYGTDDRLLQDLKQLDTLREWADYMPGIIPRRRVEGGQGNKKQENQQQRRQQQMEQQANRAHEDAAEGCAGMNSFTPLAGSQPAPSVGRRSGPAEGDRLLSLADAQQPWQQGEQQEEGEEMQLAEQQEPTEAVELEDRGMEVEQAQHSGSGTGDKRRMDGAVASGTLASAKRHQAGPARPFQPSAAAAALPALQVPHAQGRLHQPRLPPAAPCRAAQPAAADGSSLPELQAEEGMHYASRQRQHQPAQVLPSPLSGAQGAASPQQPRTTSPAQGVGGTAGGSQSNAVHGLEELAAAATEQRTSRAIALLTQEGDTLRALRQLGICGVGGSTLTDVYLGWQQLQPDKRLDVHTAVLLTAARGDWDKLEGRLSLAVDV